MGVYIKGMEMPEGCPFCPLSHWTRATNEFAGCNIVQSKRYAMLNDIEFAASLAKSRPDWCPLVEVPTPHSDLIDQGVAVQVAMEWCPDDDGTVGKIGDLRELLDEIEALPTIIEAEE